MSHWISERPEAVKFLNKEKLFLISSQALLDCSSKTIENYDQHIFKVSLHLNWQSQDNNIMVEVTTSTQPHTIINKGVTEAEVWTMSINPSTLKTWSWESSNSWVLSNNKQEVYTHPWDEFHHTSKILTFHSDCWSLVVLQHLCTVAVNIKGVARLDVLL